MKLCSRLSMVFVQKFCKKWQIWPSDHHFGEVRGDAQPGLTAHWKAHVRLSICVNWTFVLPIMIPELWDEMCTAWLFSYGGQPLCTKIYMDRVIPINHSCHQKTRDTELPDGEDCISLCSLVLTQYQSLMDRQTDGFTVAHTVLAKLALACCKNRMPETFIIGHCQCMNAKCIHCNWCYSPGNIQLEFSTNDKK